MPTGRPTHTSYPIAMTMYTSQYTFSPEMVGEKRNKSICVGGGLWQKANLLSVPGIEGEMGDKTEGERGHGQLPAVFSPPTIFP